MTAVTEDVRIIEGDCLTIMPKMAAGSVDMVLADLPYGTTYSGWDARLPITSLWSEWKRLLRPAGAVVLTASQPFTSLLVVSNLSWFRCEWVWDKVNAANFANAKRQPLKVHESVLVFSGSQPTYNPQMTQGKPNHTQGKQMSAGRREGFLIKERAPDDLSGMKYPKSIQTFPKHSSQSCLHSNQKPVELFEYLIRTYSAPGELVLDCTAGSGTTGVAARASGRNAVLIDSDPNCVRTMIDRLQLSNGSERSTAP